MKNWMKIWIKIEEMLNQGLVKVGQLLFALRPKWLIRLMQFIFSFIDNLKLKVKNHFLKVNQHFLQKISNVIILVKVEINKKSTEIDEVLKVIKKIKSQTIKDKIKTVLRGIYLTPILFIKKNPLTSSVGYSTAVLFCLLGIYNINHSKNLYQMRKKPGRSIASIKKLDTPEYKKPGYHLKRLRTLKLTGVQLPIFFNKVNHYKSMNIDFSIISSNKNIVLFLDDKEELFRDHLMMNVEQILPEFTVGTEGKRIIKEKIIMEANNFLRKYEVEGRIEEVRVGNILANP